MQWILIALFIPFGRNFYGQHLPYPGEYNYQMKGFSSTYNFTLDKFKLFESGDLGTFYGEGEYHLNDSLLVLDYDTLYQVDNSIHTGATNKTDTLIVKSRKRKALELVHTISKEPVVQRYRRTNRQKIIK